MKMMIVMMMMMLVAFATASNLTISNTLGSNMVLQRAPASAKVWGWVTPGEQVYALLDSTSITAVVSTDGFWIATLPPTPAGATHTIAVTSSDGGKIVLTNILFGEVYLCGGQSNMQFTVSQVFNSTAEIQAADNYPNIRVMSVGTLYYSPEPLDELHVPPQLPWSVASAASVGLGDWTAMSAVCWFTGRNLYDNLQVPIGLISSNWGGTVIQAWSSPTALKVCNVTTSGENNEANSVLYNAMIVPFQNYQLAGFLWYQGEQNAGQAQLYSCMFPAMINDWRTLFGSELPFFFVQLAPFAAGPSSSWPDTRQAQLNALTLDKVAFASAVDLGDATSPFGDVHPRDKQDVGKRLSVAVRAVAYGEQGLNWKGPSFSSATISQSGSSVSITVTFNVFGGALEYKNQTYPPTSIVPAEDCSNWAYQTSDGVWTEISNAELNGASVTLPFQESNTVTGIAYAYASWPITTLFDADGLPAIPFKYIVS